MQQNNTTTKNAGTPKEIMSIDLWHQTVKKHRITEELQTSQGTHRCDINPKDKSKIKKRLSINEFPCYGTQEAIDTFAIYARVSNQRGAFVPCIDCNACFQSSSCSEGKCRYPAASFTRDTEGEYTLDSLGERVYLSRYDGKKPEIKREAPAMTKYTKPLQLQMSV